MSERSIRLPLAVVEGMHLAHLVEEFASMLAESAQTVDPGIERLTPDAYPEDADASAEFAHATRGDLLDRRAADAVVVRHRLEPFLASAGDENAGDEEAGDEPAGRDTEVRDVIIPADDLDPWLRTLAALRLVIATRLDITADDDEHDPEDPRFGIYDWLGYRLDNLIAIADAHDDSLT